MSVASPQVPASQVQQLSPFCCSCLISPSTPLLSSLLECFKVNPRCCIISLLNTKMPLCTSQYSVQPTRRMPVPSQRPTPCFSAWSRCPRGWSWEPSKAQPPLCLPAALYSSPGGFHRLQAPLPGSIISLGAADGWSLNLVTLKLCFPLNKNSVHRLKCGPYTLVESEEELKSLLMRVKEESEKAGLKLTIQNTKIMASSPITF